MARAKENEPRRIVIMGAAGRDFHNFNMVYRDNPAYRVVAFTAAQIPHIEKRRYPVSLAGRLYPDGVPIVPEAELDSLCRREDVDEVVFAYSDVVHADVMHAGSRALATGADFTLLGPERTMINAAKPVIAISAVRTGCGKSQTARYISKFLKARGATVAVLRHPMPYGDLESQAVQRFSTVQELTEGNCTIEEREEYEPHIAAGNVVFAGVDYGRIVEAASREADILLWDGGNNDFPFLRPDFHAVLCDALRPGQEDTHHPGETTLRMADLVIVAKSNAAERTSIEEVKAKVRRIVPSAPIIEAASKIVVGEGNALHGRRVVVVEDGPTITHGGMSTGAGFQAASQAGAEIVDPHSSAQGEIADALARYPHIGRVLPAMGYGEAQVRDLGATLDNVDADIVVAATPVDLAALLTTAKPIVRVRYDYADMGEDTLAKHLDVFLQGLNL